MKHNPKKILCTIGPSSLNAEILKSLEHLNCSLFRINLSHTKIEDLKEIIQTIRKYSNVPICLDSEGAQIRTTKFSLNFQKDKIYSFKNTLNEFSLRPFEVIDQLDIGDQISIDFNSVVVEVVSISKKEIKVKAISSGFCGENKAVTIMKDIEIPAFSDKDLKAFEIGSSLDIKNYALSFSSNGNNVDKIRSLVPNESFIISKIESIRGLRNLLNIIERSDAILIDRGDLSRELSLEKIPVFQKSIIKNTINLNKEAYVATNLLESMIDNPLPTRAELNDIYNTLVDGASGLVLAAETAIGKYPLQSVLIAKNLINCYNYFEDKIEIDFSNPEEVLNIINKNLSETL